MKNILFIHQSADLYGSDKTLLFLVDAIKTEFNPIVVIPNEGPLSEELKKNSIEFFCLPVIKVSRDFFRVKNLIWLPITIIKAILQLKKKLGTRKIDVIHSNTIAVFLGAFYSKIYNIKHVWHVHEIIKHPRLAAKLFPKLVYLFSDKVVFNSFASAEQMYIFKPKLTNKSIVIHNGLDRNTPFINTDKKLELRKKLFPICDETSLIIGLVGRINKHKGQQLLLEVFDVLKNDFQNIFLLFIGSTITSKKHLLDELRSKIELKQLNSFVSIIDFQKDIWKFYDCMDIVTVPTTDPEPFGLVAIEGMLAKKPVIAANHGGLKEIVVNNETGILFAPNNKENLRNALIDLLASKEKRDLFANNGELRAKEIFSLRHYITNFKKLYHSF